MAIDKRESLLNYVNTTTVASDLSNLRTFLGLANDATLAQIIAASGNKLIFAGDGHIFTHGKDLLSKDNLIGNLTFDPSKVIVTGTDGKLTTSSITTAELNTLAGIKTTDSSNNAITIQNQLDELKRLATGGMTFEGVIKSATDLTAAFNKTDKSIGDMYRVVLTNGATLTIPEANLATDSVGTVKNGDTVILIQQKVNNVDTYKWTVVPSGDDIEDTWRPIKVTNTATSTLEGGTGTKTLEFISGVGIIPTATNSTNWQVKFDLQEATTSTYGGIKVASKNTNVTGVYNGSTLTAGYITTDTTNGRRYAVHMSNTGIPYVNVPWVDTDTWRPIFVGGSELLNGTVTTTGRYKLNMRSASPKLTITTGDNSNNDTLKDIIFTLLAAATDNLGAIKITGSSTSTNVTYSAGKGSSESSTNASGNLFENRDYGVKLDGDSKAFVTVPFLKYGLTTASYTKQGESTTTNVTVTAITGSPALSGSDGLMSPQEKYNLNKLVEDRNSGASDSWRPIYVNHVQKSSANSVVSGNANHVLDFVSTESGVMATSATTTENGISTLHVGFSLAWYNISTGLYELPTTGVYNSSYDF